MTIILQVPDNDGGKWIGITQSKCMVPNSANITPNICASPGLTSVVAASPALVLQFSINGTPVGPIFSPGGTLCNWQQYFQTWDSGNNSSATICIVNQNTVLGGNDFALDDIVFAPVCTVTDTVHVEVINITAFAAPSVVTLPCDGAEVTLSGIDRVQESKFPTNGQPSTATSLMEKLP
ncbi:MAG: hypothetical protein R2778_12345 [Saprospiraceae bacterium]